MKTLTLRAPAKLNLFLDVIGRRPDGYHDIETVFERINLADRLTFEPAGRGIHLVCKGGPALKRNIVYKAAAALREYVRTSRGVRITLEKKIPIGMGLGGGSSDAAATLLGLNRFWKLGLSRQGLIPLALGLGSDVAFFIYGKSFALARFRGEEIWPLKKLCSCYHVLVCPRKAMLTKNVYQSLKRASRDTRHLSRDVLSALARRDCKALGRAIYNRLEEPVLAARRDVWYIKKILTTLRLPAMVTGSGAAVFAITKTRKEAEAAREKLEALKKGWRIFVVRTL